MNIDSVLTYLLDFVPGTISIPVPPEGFEFTLAGHKIKLESPAIDLTITKS